MRLTEGDLHRQLSEDVRALNPDLFGDPQGKPKGIVRMDALPENPRGNKYGARKVKIGGRTFDSRAEARRYLDLDAQAKAGEISNLECQVRIELLPGFEYRGEKVRAVHYTADFVYVKGGKTIIEDIKSAATARTEAFRLRWRLLQWHFRDRDDVICLTRGD